MLFAALACLLLLKPSAASNYSSISPAFPTFEGCTADQERELSEGINHMLRMVDKTILAGQTGPAELDDIESFEFVKIHYPLVREKMFGKTTTTENFHIHHVIQSLQDNWRNITWNCADPATDDRSKKACGHALGFTDHEESRAYLCPSTFNRVEGLEGQRRESNAAHVGLTLLQHTIIHEAFHCHAIASLPIHDVCPSWECIPTSADWKASHSRMSRLAAYGPDATQRLALGSTTGAMRNADNWAIFLRHVYGLYHNELQPTEKHLSAVHWFWPWLHLFMTDYYLYECMEKVESFMRVNDCWWYLRLIAEFIDDWSRLGTYRWVLSRAPLPEDATEYCVLPVIVQHEFAIPMATVLPYAHVAIGLGIAWRLYRRFWLRANSAALINDQDETGLTEDAIKTEEQRKKEKRKRYRENRKRRKNGEK